MTTQNEEWLALTMENPVDPNLPICDPHHHLWDHPDDRYLPEDFLHDTVDQKVVKTVFVECSAMYRKDGPQEVKPVGETEFVQGIAAQSENGKYGKTNIAAGIVGFADLTLGKAVEPVLEAHIASGKNHFRGIRHPTVQVARRDLRRSGLQRAVPDCGEPLQPALSGPHHADPAGAARQRSS